MTDIVDRLRLTNADFLHEEAADEIERLRNALREIAIRRPDIPEDEEGNGPNWPCHVFTMMWASFSTELKNIARAALKESDND